MVVLGAMLLQRPLQLLHLTLLLHQPLVDQPGHSSSSSSSGETGSSASIPTPPPPPPPPSPVLGLQLAGPAPGVLQQALQQRDLLVVRALLLQLQHLVLVLQADQVLPGGGGGKSEDQLLLAHTHPAQHQPQTTGEQHPLVAVYNVVVVFIASESRFT